MLRVLLMTRRKMSKAEAVDVWTREILPDVRRTFEADGRPDYPARCESWGAWTDALCKDGAITPAQYHNWSAPPACGK